MRLEKHSLLSFDRNSFRKCVRFLSESDRWAMRVVSKTVDDSLRQEYSFAQMIICDQGGSLSFAHIKQLRSKFQFHALKLLVIPLSDVVGGSIPSDDLVVMLADLPGLRLSLRDIYERGRGAVLASTVEAADSLSSKDGWADNDRWRISMCYKHPVLTPGVDFGSGHPRITACEWDMGWGPLPSAQEWVGKLALARNSEMPPTGSYPILTSVDFCREGRPLDWLVDWLAQTDSPLLSDLMQVDLTSENDPYGSPDLSFEGSVEQCWLARPLTVEVKVSDSALIEFLKNRSWKIDLRYIDLFSPTDEECNEAGHLFSPLDEWGNGRLNCETLKEIRYSGGGDIWIKKYAQFSLPNLRIIALINVNVKAWREYLLNVEIPMLQTAELCDYKQQSADLDVDDVLELLQLPVFSLIKTLRISTTAPLLFGGWDPISLPELRDLSCTVLQLRGVQGGNLRFLAPLRFLFITWRGRRFDNLDDFRHRMEHQFPCAKVFVHKSIW